MKAEDAHTNLGLGSSATRDVGLVNANLMEVGAFGIGQDSSLAAPVGGMSNVARAGIYTAYGDETATPTAGLPAGSGNTFYGLITATVYSTASAGLLFSRDKVYSGLINPTNSNASTWRMLWGEPNTTVDTNGFIKKASPIVQLFGDGHVVTNDEAEGVLSEKLAVGVYRITGSNGLHPDRWTVEIPQDMNGNFLCFVEIESADGVITVSVFNCRFDISTAMVVAGEPVDIPDERWIDLRLEMPEDSIWHQKQAAADMLESEGS